MASQLVAQMRQTPSFGAITFVNQIEEEQASYALSLLNSTTKNSHDSSNNPPQLACHNLYIVMDKVNRCMHAISKGLGLQRWSS